jgi:hypothetical protein
MSEIISTDYSWIIVESYYESGAGLHGVIHMRPVPGQNPYKPSYRVEGAKSIMRDPEIHPVGTRFKIWAKITNRQGTPFVYTNYNWNFEVLT